MFGSIVLSKAGRDKERFFVVSKMDENYVYLVDGELHKVENPKCKKNKHISETEFFSETFSTRFKNNNKVTNQDIKKFLKSINVFQGRNNV